MTGASQKSFFSEIFIFDVFDAARVGVGLRCEEAMERRRKEEEDGAVENLHNTLYGHGFVAIETTRESFRQHCRLHAKWKVYLARGSVCGGVLNGRCLGSRT